MVVLTPFKVKKEGIKEKSLELGLGGRIGCLWLAAVDVEISLCGSNCARRSGPESIFAGVSVAFPRGIDGIIDIDQKGGYPRKSAAQEIEVHITDIGLIMCGGLVSL